MYRRKSCSGMKACAYHPNSYVEILIFKVNILGGGTFWGIWSLKVEPSWMIFITLQKRFSRAAFVFEEKWALTKH